MLNKPLEQITIDDLQQLIDDEEQEGKIIDYKQSMYRIDPLTRDERKSLSAEQKKKRQEDRDDQIKELVKDVSSFSNTVGGHLIIGMVECNGVPTEICGVEVENPDAKKLQLDELIQKWAEPRLNATIRSIDTEDGRHVFLVRIPQSLSAPHRVTHQEFGHFFSRNSAGAFRMDTGQLRAAFTFSETVFDRIRAFRKERVEQIIAGDAPVPMRQGAKMILHLIPLESFSARLLYDVHSLESFTRMIPPLSARHFDHRFNMDGIVTHCGGGREGDLVDVKAYTQLFRNGIIEAVNGDIAYPDQETQGVCYRKNYNERYLVEGLPTYLQCQHELGIPLPVWCFLTLTGVKGVRIYSDRFFGPTPPIERDVLYLPEALIEDFSVESWQIANPFCDMIWNAAGMRECPCFDKDGKLRDVQ